jgi:hypothetical protein
MKFLSVTVVMALSLTLGFSEASASHWGAKPYVAKPGQCAAFYVRFKLSKVPSVFTTLNGLPPNQSIHCAWSHGFKNTAVDRALAICNRITHSHDCKVFDKSNWNAPDYSPD